MAVEKGDVYWSLSGKWNQMQNIAFLNIKVSLTHSKVSETENLTL